MSSPGPTATATPTPTPPHRRPRRPTRTATEWFRPHRLLGPERHRLPGREGDRRQRHRRGLRRQRRPGSCPGLGQEQVGRVRQAHAGAPHARRRRARGGARGDPLPGAPVLVQAAHGDGRRQGRGRPGEVLQARRAAEGDDRRPRHLPEHDRPHDPVPGQAPRRPEHGAVLPAARGEAARSAASARCARSDRGPARPARRPRSGCRRRRRGCRRGCTRDPRGR